MSSRHSGRAASGVKSEPCFRSGPPVKPEPSSDNETSAIPLANAPTRGERRRPVSLYDAVAGRVKTIESLKRSEQRRNRTEHPPPSGDAANFSRRDPRLAPEEVLFRHKRAPERFAEKDIYFANEDLPDGGRSLLPDSDLLKSIHAYSSRFYEAMGRRRGPASFVGSRLVDEASMDETALLAMGILLEEAAREALGKRGDLVFTEGVKDGQTERGEDGTEERKEKVAEEYVTVGYNSEDELWRRRYPKRLKVSHMEEPDASTLGSLSLRPRR